MEISESHIRTWANSADGPNRIPSLVYRLIYETTPELIEIEVPEGTAINSGGVDGVVKNSVATPWVPEGNSYWEFSGAKKIESKARKDFLKRKVEYSPSDQKSSSFIFVTSQRWNNKRVLESELNENSSWNYVKLLDSKNLVNWINASTTTRNWFINQQDLPSKNLLSADEWWIDWATMTRPSVSTSLVSKRHFNESAELLNRIKSEESVISIMGDTRDEAVAFAVATILETSDEKLKARTHVVKNQDVNIQSKLGAKSILILNLPDETDPHFGDRDKFIIVRPFYKGELQVQYPIKLSQVSTVNFYKELENSGLSRQKVEELGIRSGKSIPVLRRLLSNEPQLRQKWSGSRDEAQKLIPFLLCGSWVNDDRFDDYSILELLGNIDKKEIQKNQEKFLGFEDSPLQKFGNTVVVKSQFDALISAGFILENEHIDRFLSLVGQLLGERDPILDLPEEKWYMRNFLGKERSYSEQILTGLCESLCILANYEDSICDPESKLYISERIDELMKTVLNKADKERWLSIQKYLTYIAEAAPETFLKCIQADLDKKNPEIKVLMRSIDDNYSGYCLRSNLLWSLEMLAWHKEYFKRVVRILFQLQPFEIPDNWSNTSFETANSLFRVWLPSTEVSIQKRFEILKDLFPEFRISVLDVCISLLPKRISQVGTITARPKWNLLEKEISEVSHKDIYDSHETSRNLLINFKPYNTKEEFKKVLEVITDLELKQVKALANEVKRWTKTVTDDERMEVMESLRSSIRRLHYIKDEDTSSIFKEVENIEKSLLPKLPSIRHRWLFNDYYIDETLIFENAEKEEHSFEKTKEKTVELRRNAVNEILEKESQKALLNFTFDIKNPELVAQVLLPNDASTNKRASWIGKVLTLNQTELTKRFIQQTFGNLTSTELKKTLEIMKNEGVLKSKENVDLLVESLPANKIGWNVAKDLGSDAEHIYWSKIEFSPWSSLNLSDLQFLIKKLIDFGRPKNAFFAAGKHFEKLPTKILIKLLSNLLNKNSEKGYMPDKYNIEKAFKILDKDKSLTEEEIAKIELPYLPILLDYGLNKSDRISAWHRLMSKDPKYLMEPLSWMYKREDGAEEPLSKKSTEEEIRFFSHLAFQLFSSWTLTPGVDKNGKLNEKEFEKWVNEAYIVSKDISRVVMFEKTLSDIMIKYAKKISSDNWLPPVMLKFLEQSDDLRSFVPSSITNARGITKRGPEDGGDQEREIASEYAELAKKFKEDYPNVAKILQTVAKQYETEAKFYDNQMELRVR